MGDWMRSVISEVLRELFVFTGLCPIASVHFSIKASDRGTIKHKRERSIGAPMTRKFEGDAWQSVVHRTLAPDTSGHHTGRVRSVRPERPVTVFFLPSEGVTTILALGATNRRGTRAWLRLSTSGDFVSMLESAWEPSNSLVLARLRINSE
jgi:hypothetical protein